MLPNAAAEATALLLIETRGHVSDAELSNCQRSAFKRLLVDNKVRYSAGRWIAGGVL